jgi:GT2 family glycosyltransferase
VSPDVSIIVVTWNGRAHLEKCLQAIAAQEGVSAETILVDNASTDGSADYVRDAFPWVRIVSMSQNLGFRRRQQRWRPRRLRAPMSRFSTTTPSPIRAGCRALRAGIDLEARFALTTSRIVYMHDPGTLDSAGDGLLRWGGAFKRHHGAPTGDAPESREVFGVCGAACLMPRAVFDEIGGFDEDFFASHEDVDLSYRARLRGYKCKYVASAVVKHRGSATLGSVSPFAVFQGQRNLEWMYLKNTPGSLLVRTLAGHAIYDAAAAIHFARLGLLGTFCRAKVAALAGLPRMLRKRSAIQATRVVGAGAIEPLLDRRWLSRKMREKRFDVSLAGGTR